MDLWGRGRYIINYEVRPKVYMAIKSIVFAGWKTRLPEQIPDKVFRYLLLNIAVAVRFSDKWSEFVCIQAFSNQYWCA